MHGPSSCINTSLLTCSSKRGPKSCSISWAERRLPPQCVRGSDGLDSLLARQLLRTLSLGSLGDRPLLDVDLALAVGVLCPSHPLLRNRVPELQHTRWRVRVLNPLLQMLFRTQMPKETIHGSAKDIGPTAEKTINLPHQRHGHTQPLLLQLLQLLQLLLLLEAVVYELGHGCY